MTPGFSLTLGDTRDTDRRFRRRAWQTYLDSASWGFEPEPPRDASDTRDEAERTEATFRQYYDAQTLFDRGNAVIDRDMTTLATTLSRQNMDQRRQTLEGELPTLFAGALSLGQLFQRWARAPSLRLNQSRRGIASRMRGRSVYIWSSSGTDRPHPLTRMVMTLEFAQAQGITLSAEQQAFMRWCEGVAGFGRQIELYRRAGLPASLIVQVPPSTE